VEYKRKSRSENNGNNTDLCTYCRECSTSGKKAAEQASIKLDLEEDKIAD
jgi:hypothetical protein